MTHRGGFDPAPHGPTLPGKMAAVLVVAIIIVGLYMVWISDPLGVLDSFVRRFQ